MRDTCATHPLLEQGRRLRVYECTLGIPAVEPREPALYWVRLDLQNRTEPSEFFFSAPRSTRLLKRARVSRLKSTQTQTIVLGSAEFMVCGYRFTLARIKRCLPKGRSLSSYFLDHTAGP